MKKLLFLMSMMLVLTLTSFSQNLKSLDEKYGFREAKFEMPYDSFKNLTEVETGWYKSTDENLKLGDYILDAVVYNFYKGQLAAIAIQTKGYSNSRGVLKILQAAYGKGYQSNQFIEEYYWFGKKVIMSYNQNSITDDAIIFIHSIKMSDLEKAEKDNANSKAVNQL
jgi:hypothetical protein